MSSKERAKILDLLADGSITASEAATLLENIDEAEAAPAEKSIDELKETEQAIIISEDLDAESYKSGDVEIDTANGEKPRWLRIRVRNLKDESDRVTVNVPLWLVSAGFRVAQRFDSDLGGINGEMFQEMVSNGQRGVLVDVLDEDDGEHVQIYLD